MDVLHSVKIPIPVLSFEGWQGSEVVDVIVVIDLVAHSLYLGLII